MSVEQPKSKAEIVADYWATDRKGERYISWLEHPVIIRNYNRRVTGDPAIDPGTWFKRTYLTETPDLGLSLGCGLGPFECNAIRAGFARRFHANDISPGAIEYARRRAETAGLSDRIEYSVLDLDTGELPKNTYDIVFGLSSIHHVFHLEHLFKQIRDSMRPGALFYLNEYIGPTRFHSDPEVVDIINRIRSKLPKRLRYSLFAKNGSDIGKYTPSPVEHFEKHDPSEAVRSGEIMSILRLYFDVLEFRPFGGTILHMLLSGITGNFEESSEEDVALLEMFMLTEELLEKAGSIKPDFAVIVAKPKAG